MLWWHTKQSKDGKEQIIAFTSKHWNNSQQNYSTIEKEVLAIALCVSKFQAELLNQKFLLTVDCKLAKHILEKKC